MIDARLRPWINRPLDACAAALVRSGWTADALTWAGLVIGLLAAAVITCGAPLLGLALFAVNRGVDGLDGAVARLSTPSDRGGFLDIVADFLIYASIPLAFAVVNPSANALAAATLLAAIIASGTTFLAFAVLAAKRHLTTTAQGEKSIYYLAGLAEGFETIVAFALMCLWPTWFAAIAYAFAALCIVSAMARIWVALNVLR